MFVNMFAIIVCALVLFATTDVQGRYVFEPTLHGSIETNKIISAFEDAVSQCKTEGAVLAAPLNEQLRDEMMALIGVNNHSTPYFINAKLVHSDKPQFVSSEGVSLDAMSVSDMIEELDPRDGECLAMDSRTIRVVSCSAPLPYMCYKENAVSPPAPYETTTEEMAPCDSSDAGYQYYSSTGSCYKFHDEEKNWDEARDACAAEGGYLVILNNDHEAKVVLAMGHYFMFIGLRDMTENDKGWASVHGDLFDDIYHTWHDGHITLSNEYCGSIFRTGGLETFPCYVRRAFTCEMDMGSKLRRINGN
ncbi:macrophage mannose receptor 1-like [Anticarsia gemmatalis]|uniref:macrophage mannose receptor 1-like n=1 Tax=Anticarsia gemmatalis TaxID=129554 RepID=UPI003F76951A